MRITLEEALDISINEDVSSIIDVENYWTTDDTSDYFKIVCQALQKQIPRKTIILLNSEKIGLCPNCRGTQSLYNRYCNECGQKIDSKELNESIREEECEMVVNNKDREDLFNKFVGLEFRVSGLKSVVQNEINITEDIMIEYSKEVQSVMGDLSNLSNEVYVKLLECIEK